MNRVQDAKGKGEKGNNDHQKGEGKDAKGKGKKEERDQKGEEGDHRGKSKGKDHKGKGVAACYTCGNPGNLARVVGEAVFNRLQVIQMQPIHLQEELQ